MARMNRIEKPRASGRDSLDFHEFEDFAFRKSAASSISGISRKPVGIEDFEDFKDAQDLSSERSSLSES